MNVLEKFLEEIRDLKQKQNSSNQQRTRSRRWKISGGISKLGFSEVK